MIFQRKCEEYPKLILLNINLMGSRTIAPEENRPPPNPNRNPNPNPNPNLQLY